MTALAASVLPAPEVAPPTASTVLRAQVLLAAPLGLLDYAVPADWTVALRPGMAVTVPLGRRQLQGYVVRLQRAATPAGRQLKTLLLCHEARLALPPALLETILLAATYYGCTPGELLRAALPSLQRPASAKYRLTAAAHVALATPNALQPSWQRALQAVASCAVGCGAKTLASALGVQPRTAAQKLLRLQQDGWLETLPRSAPRQVNVYYRSAALQAADLRVLKPRQTACRALFELLPTTAANALSAAQLESRLTGARRHLNTLLRHGLAQQKRLAVYHAPSVAAAAQPATLIPNLAQANALSSLQAALETARFAAFLLHGITGSGKTEVYLRLIAAALAMGRSALILVPEIALTPQLGERFRARFGTQVATFHSGLSAAQRRDAWLRVQSGAANIGLGARSALFLPMQRLGVIIVDEEHDTSFKQDEAPRYHARDLAVWRGRLAQAVVLLGSATPSLESHHNTLTGRYTALHLPQRVAGRALPEVTCINLAEHRRLGDGVFTQPLLDRMATTLNSGEQVILFLNRRGFAPYVFCRDCGHSYRCQACAVSLTLHQQRGMLACHYCGFCLPIPSRCASCQGEHVGAQGLGTEKVQQAVQTLFPGVATLRLDRDMVRRKNDLEQVLGRFARREAQVLVGTQMVAKGHDFAGVTCVGVISADSSLNFPDFRAAERTFQLLTQVAGRAGRGEQAGHVLVQAYETQHYAITAARQHDYPQFVQHERQMRQELGYPPFAHLALNRFEGHDEALTLQLASDFANHLRQQLQRDGVAVSVLGPAPAPLARLRDVFRFQVLLKAAQRRTLQHVLQHLQRLQHPSVRQILDVDPIHML